MKSQFNTDKIYLHGYFPVYMQIALDLGPRARVCELGVETGESLRMWQSLFPMGEITGVDIKPQAIFPHGTRKVIASQDDPRLKELGPFDLVVDDASHKGTLTRASLDILWPQVNPGGYYVVEDWFVGIRPHIDGAFDRGMLDVIQEFLKLLTKDSDCESVTCRYGLAILRKKP